MTSSKQSNIPRNVSIGAVVVGVVVLILAGVLGWVVVPNIIEDKVKEETRLVDTGKDNDTFQKWRDLPVPIHISFYFFNVTNYHEFEGTDDWSKDPQVKEVGPYVFRETRTKYDIKEGPDDTLFYRQNITYVFDEEMSGQGLTEHDNVTILNVPLIAALTLLDVHKNVTPLAPTVLRSLLLAGERLVSPNVTVKNLTFTGVNLKPVYQSVETVARLFNIPLPDELSGGKFAFYRGKNATNAEGEWQVYRGVQDSAMFSIVRSVNDGKTRLEPWWDDHCAMINGTDGTMFPPFIKKSTRLYIYVPEICRSIYMDFDSTTEYEGIPGYRFKLPVQMFQGPHLNPDNYCYCMPVMKPLNDTCNFSGLGRLFSCKANVPIAISKPHFLDADEWVQELAMGFGLDPRASDHDTYLDIEPNTGFPLRVHKRLQVGAEIQPFLSMNMKPYDTIPHTLYPVFWADESAELDQELIDELKSKLIKPLNLVKIGKWTLIGIGALLVLAGVMVFGYIRFKK